MTRRARRYDRPAPVEVAPDSDLMFPKTRFVPHGDPDLSGLAFPKEHPDRNRPYLDMVRGEICAVNSADPTHCMGVTEAAHLEVYGKAIKASDYLTVPLCTYHHREQHQLGIAPFQIQHAINLWEVSTRLLVRWLRRIK